MSPKTVLTRREFAKEASGLLIGFSLLDSGIVPRLLAAVPPESAETPSPARLDAWLRIEKDGTIRVFTGKSELGMGVKTGFIQIIAEELDVAPAQVDFVMGDTALTPDQGGVGGSTSIAMGAKPLRNVAATTRMLLMQLASQRLGAPVDQLEVMDGIVSVKDNASQHVSYGELAGGTDLNDALKVSGQGFSLDVQGTGKPKDPANYTVVGKSIPRVDLEPKILGQWKYVTDVRLPGMLHGRVIRPAGVGANVVDVNDDDAKSIPGYLKTVVKGNFVGVVAESEWAAIKALRAVKVNWSKPETPFPEQRDLYEHMRTTTPKASKETVKKGDAEGSLASAAKKVEATYEFPFQSHSTMGPGCAVADVQVDGVTTVWSGCQKPHGLQNCFAEILGVPKGRVRVIWTEDAGSYGRPGVEDAAADAVLLSQAVGKPVRVQWMRSDMTSWGSKGPAVTYHLVAGLDAQNEVNSLQFTSHAFSGGDVYFMPTGAGNFLSSQLMGIPNTTGTDEFAQWGNQTYAYPFPNVHAVAHVVPALYPNGSPLRTSHLRDPEGPATTFAGESFMDEIAAAAGTDPVAFRMKYLDDDRVKAVLAKAAETYGWDSRPSPKKHTDKISPEIAIGRGVAVVLRGGTRVATIAEVEVNRKTGVVRVKRLVCVHDCGLIVNPEALRGTVAANLIQSMSRALKEEVTFDRSNVTSLDWLTYPVVRASDIPGKVDIVLLNHPEAPPTGAGEPSSRATPAAIANAVFDATGARVRQGPLTPTRVKSALASMLHS